ncbi:trypsin-like peptidase domain-containing protein [Streptomyces sp. NPDC052013]|uniref:trypsin-like peptidase domain-containing protein n=1 Tax=Streptomyces sp. NPDC052013 TaxID=3365679 RepID=UPI0037D3DD49
MNLNSIRRQILFSTVRLDNDKTSGIPETGTGFLVMGYLDDGRGCPVVITNKHVVADAAKLTARFIARKPGVDEPNLGQEAEVKLPTDTWVGHPNDRVDVAAIPLGHGWDEIIKHCYNRVLPMSMLSTDTEDLEIDAIEEVTFVGYPSGLHDPKHFTPIARRGITATPIDMDMGGDPAFWVDGSVFGGSSGSPVYILDDRQPKPRFALVGIIAAAMQRLDKLPVRVGYAPHVDMAQALNLGVAFNARAIRETLETLMATAGGRIKPLGAAETEALTASAE